MWPPSRTKPMFSYIIWRDWLDNCWQIYRPKICQIMDKSTADTSAKKKWQIFIYQICQIMNHRLQDRQKIQNPLYPTIKTFRRNLSVHAPSAAGPAPLPASAAGNNHQSISFDLQNGKEIIISRSTSTRKHHNKLPRIDRFSTHKYKYICRVTLFICNQMLLLILL